MVDNQAIFIFDDCHVRAYDADGKMIEYERKSTVAPQAVKPPEK